MKAVNNKKLDSKIITVNTKPFGEIEICSKDIISFPDGIFAFEYLKDYVLLSTKKELSFRWLQSLEEKNVAFLMTDPLNFLPDYLPKIPKANLELIQIKKEQALNLFCIVTIPSDHPEQMTMNLQGPVVINFDAMLAAQFVSEDPAHEVRQPLLALLNINKNMDAKRVI